MFSWTFQNVLKLSEGVLAGSNKVEEVLDVLDGLVFRAGSPLVWLVTRFFIFFLHRVANVMHDNLT